MGRFRGSRQLNRSATWGAPSSPNRACFPVTRSPRFASLHFCFTSHPGDGVGSYVSASAFQDWLGEAQTIRLTNDNRTASTVDTDRLNEAIDTAEASVNVALGARYDLPLTAPYPSIVVSITRRMTRWWLWDRREQQPPTRISEQFAADSKTLEAIRKGTLPLALTTDGTPDDTGDGGRVEIRAGYSARRLDRAGFESF